jgi:hypothetical protein
MYARWGESRGKRPLTLHKSQTMCSGFQPFQTALYSYIQIEELKDGQNRADHFSLTE